MPSSHNPLFRVLKPEETELSDYRFVPSAISPDQNHPANQDLSKYSSHFWIENNLFEQKLFLIEFIGKSYSTVSIESTMLILDIFRNGIAVANKQAPTAKNAASMIGKTGIATN